MNKINPKLVYTKNLLYKNNPDWIVIHHALKSACTIQDVHSWHIDKGWAGCGYHFFVDKVGRVFEGRPVNAVGAHCPGLNRLSIGICLEGCYQEFGNQTDREVPQEQYRALVDLVIYLKGMYGIRGEHVIRHADRSDKLCPGNFFPWTTFKHEVMEEIYGLVGEESSYGDIYELSNDLLYEEISKTKHFTLSDDLLVFVLLAQLEIESNLNPKAVNSVSGAKGIAQFVDSSWKKWGQGDPFNVRDSIQAQVRYMDFLFSKFGEIPNDLERLKFSLASYNVGRMNINRILSISRQSSGHPDSHAQWVQNGRPPGDWQYWWYTSRFIGDVVSGSLGDNLGSYISKVWNKTIQNLAVK